MKEFFRICSQKPNHRFAATELWRDREECPYCKCKMDLIEIDTKVPNERRRSLRRVTRDEDAIGYNRSLKIDSLPRLPWFNEAIDYNEVDQDKARDIWTMDDAAELLKLYREYGIRDAKTWNSLASNIGRSLYAVERQLRIIINCGDELEKHYPPAKPIRLVMA